MLRIPQGYKVQYIGGEYIQTKDGLKEIIKELASEFDESGVTYRYLILDNGETRVFTVKYTFRH